MTNKINIYIFFMISSFLMFFGVNLSFFFFFNLIYWSIKSTNLNIFKINNKSKFFALLFGLGALSSTINNFNNELLFNSSLSVLPNYIYWVLMIIYFSSFQNKFKINQYLVFKSISFAVLLLIFYYLLFHDVIANKIFFKKFTPNNIAFLLICYVPYLIFYLKRKYSFTISFFIFISILVLLLISGRRAGFVIVAIGGLATLFHNNLINISIFKVIKNIIILLSIVLIIQIKPIKNKIFDTSPRIHKILYNDNYDLSIDRSALVRKAMIKKGFNLLSSNILFGVGLNNFNKSETEISGDFEGSEYIINKDIFRKISSHNSYINILAEGGLFLGIPFVLILLFIIKNFIFNFSKLNDFDLIIFISFSCMLLHFYFINSITNSLSWLNICLALTTINRIKNKL